MLLQDRAEEFYTKLCGELKRFSQGERFYPVREMIREFEVSYRVVSAVLARLEREGMLERRDRSGLYVRSARPRRSVAYFYIDWPGKHSQLLADNFGRELRELGDYEFSALPFNYQSNFIAQLENCPADFIITDWPSRTFTDAERIWLAGFRTPLVVCDRDLRDMAMHCFYSNTAYGVLLALNCFLRNGHRRIGVLLAQPPVGSFRMAYRNFIDFARLNGCETVPVECNCVSGNYAPEQARVALQRHLERFGINFTGLFVISGSSVKGVLPVLHEYGIRVPEDVSIIAHGDPEEAAFFTPPLTTIGGRETEAARDKALAVHRYLHDPSTGPIAVEYKAALIERKSVRNLNTVTSHLKEHTV